MHVVSLGRHTQFLIPSVKLFRRKYSKTRQNVAETIHHFLKDEFGGYTCASGNIFGHFGSTSSDSDEYDELRQYNVAIKDDAHGTGSIRLQRFLADICADIQEECIFFVCGENAMLIYPGEAERPKKKQKKRS